MGVLGTPAGLYVRVSEPAAASAGAGRKPFRLGKSEADRFAPVQQSQRRLAKPLFVSLHMDVDKRVPDEWVWPLLTAPFEEIQDK